MPWSVSGSACQHTYRLLLLCVDNLLEVPQLYKLTQTQLGLPHTLHDEKSEGINKSNSHTQQRQQHSYSVAATTAY